VTVIYISVDIYSDWLRAGRSGDRIPVGAKFSAPVETGPGAHPASCTMGTGSFPGVKSGQGVTLNAHSLLVPWSRRSRAIILLPLRGERPVQSLNTCTRVHYIYTYKETYFQCTNLSYRALLRQLKLFSQYINQQIHLVKYSNIVHKIQFMTSMKLLHVSAPRRHPICFHSCKQPLIAENMLILRYSHRECSYHQQMHIIKYNL